MYINLKRLKAPEIRKLAKAYNKLNNIPHPSTLKKSELIAYLKEHLETNEKGHVNVSHPKLQKSIQPAIDRLKGEYEESKKELEKVEKEIRADIEKHRPKQKAPEPSFRDTLTKEQRDAEDRRMKHLIETGKLLFEKQPERKRTKKEIEREKAITKQLDEERKAEQEAKSKRNQEIMKKVREELKAKEEKRKPKKPTKKKEEEKPQEEEEEDDMTPEEKKMQAYFASIKDPEQRKKEVKEWMMKQRANIRKKVEAKEKEEEKDDTDYDFVYHIYNKAKNHYEKYHTRYKVNHIIADKLYNIYLKHKQIIKPGFYDITHVPKSYLKNSKGDQFTLIFYPTGSTMTLELYPFQKNLGHRTAYPEERNISIQFPHKIEVVEAKEIPKKLDTSKAQKLIKELKERNIKREERKKFLEKIKEEEKPKLKKLDTSKAQKLIKELEERNIKREERKKFLEKIKKDELKLNIPDDTRIVKKEEKKEIIKSIDSLTDTINKFEKMGKTDKIREYNPNDIFIMTAIACLAEKGEIKCPIPQLSDNDSTIKVENTLSKIINCIKKGEDSIIILLGALEHENLIIIKPKLNELYRYEPQFFNIDDDITELYELYKKKTNNMSKEEFKKVINQHVNDLEEQFNGMANAIIKYVDKKTKLKLNYKKPIDICPRMPVGLYNTKTKKGYQWIEELSGDKDIIEGGGYCVLWSLFFGILVISNPNLSVEEVMTKGYEIMKNDPKTFRFVIRGFYADILQKLDKLKKKYEEEIKNSFFPELTFARILKELIEDKHKIKGGAINSNLVTLKKHGINLGYIGGCNNNCSC